MQTNVILAGKCDSQLAIIINSTTIFCEDVVVVKTSYQMFRNFINLASGEGFTLNTSLEMEISLLLW